MVIRPLLVPSFGSINFLSGMETLNAPISSSEPCRSHITNDCDVFFAVSAPAEFVSVPVDAAVVLYFDPPEDGSRELPANAYQITCPNMMSKQHFRVWAERVTQMIRDGIMQTGLSAVDVMDLHAMLRGCDGRRLLAHVIDYDDVNHPPVDMLRKLRFKNIFAWLFADDNINLEHFAELGCLLEEVNPSANYIRLCANIHQESSARLLLLGEPST